MRSALTTLFALPLLVVFLFTTPATAMDRPDDTTASKTKLALLGFRKKAPQRKYTPKHAPKAKPSAQGTKRTERTKRTQQIQAKTTTVSTSPGLTPTWQANLKTPLASAPVATPHGMVVLTQNNVTLLNATTGQSRWTRQLPEKPVGAAFHNNTLWVNGASGTFYRINLSNGTVQGYEALHAPLVGSPVWTAKGLVVATRTGTVMLLHPTTGQRVWQHNVEKMLGTTPAVSGNSVVVGGLDGQLWRLDLTQGKALWKTPAWVEGPLTATPLVHKGKIYQASMVGAVFVVDEESAQRVWSYTSPSGSAMVATPTIVGDRLFIGDLAGHVGCVDAERGLRLWQTETHQPLISAFQPSGTQLVTLSAKGELLTLPQHATRQATHQETTATRVFQSKSLVHYPLVRHQNHLVWGTQNGTVYQAAFAPGIVARSARQSSTKSKSRQKYRKRNKRSRR